MALNWSLKEKEQDVEESVSCRNSKTAPDSVRRARENSLSVKGAGMFSLLSEDIRKVTSNKDQHFKSKLDER